MAVSSVRDGTGSNEEDGVNETSRVEGEGETSTSLLDARLSLLGARLSFVKHPKKIALERKTTARQMFLLLQKTSVLSDVELPRVRSVLRNGLRNLDRFSSSSPHEHEAACSVTHWRVLMAFLETSFHRPQFSICGCPLFFSVSNPNFTNVDVRVRERVPETSWRKADTM